LRALLSAMLRIPASPRVLQAVIQTHGYGSFRCFPGLSTAAAAPKELHPLSFSSLSTLRSLQNHSQQSRRITYAQKAKDLNQQGIDDQLSDYDTAIADEKEKQTKTPWHREGADTPPVRRQRSAGAMTKGRRSKQTHAAQRQHVQ
jgi:hypothetical protein